MELGYAISSEEHAPVDLRELLAAFEDAGGAGKPRFGQLTVCWAESEEEAGVSPVAPSDKRG